MEADHPSFFTRRGFLSGSVALAGAATLRGVTPGQPESAPAAKRGQRRDLLASACSAARLKVSLLPRAKFQPFPMIQDRVSWTGLRAESRAALLAQGEKYLRYQWPEMPATAFLEYSRTGNRTGYESLRGARTGALEALMVAECIEGQGRFLDDLVNGIWATCEESFWGVPAHLFLQKSQTGLPDPQEPVVDLFAAQTAALLATAVYLLNTKLDSVSPVLRERVYLESERRIFQPLLSRDFPWMGLPVVGKNPVPVNNWDPWICWNWLTTALLLDQDEDRRYRGVAKALACLDIFINSYPDDGGCEEGPAYWNVASGAMFDALELLYAATGGAVDIFSNPLIAQMGLYINRVHIAGRYYINPGDAPPVIYLDVDKVFRYGRRVRKPELMALAASSIPANYLPDSLPAIFNEAALRALPGATAGLLRDVWLPDAHIMAARSKADSLQGLYLAAIAADNGKSHSHNDTGSFWVYSQGTPVLIDMGKQTYQKNSFGPHRYDIPSMQSAYHNLPTIGEVQQGVGRQFRATDLAYEMTDASARLSMELATAYPPEAMLTSWRRTVMLDRVGVRIEINDSYVLARRVGEIALSLMTPCDVAQVGSGQLVLTSARGAPPTSIHFDAHLLAVSVETIPLDDAELKQSWGARIFRIQLKSASPSLRGQFMLTITQQA